jgi:hypothetical protein
MQEIFLLFFFAYTTTTLHESHVLSASLGGDWGPLKTLKETLQLLPGFYCGSMTNLRRFGVQGNVSLSYQLGKLIATNLDTRCSRPTF